MAISRRRFLGLSFGTTLTLLMASMFGTTKSLFAHEEKVTEKMHKVGDKVPKAGRHQCIVCGLIVEYLPKHIKKEATFGICTLCRSGTEKGRKKPHEEFWKYIG